MPLSQKQMEYLALAWQCFESDPKIDYEKFKTVAGLASAASARELMRVTKIKLKSEYGALSGKTKASNVAGTPTPKKTNATPGRSATPASKKQRTGAIGSKKRAAAKMDSAADEDVDDEDVETPCKKAPNEKKEVMEVGKVELEAEGEAEAEDEDTPDWIF